MLDFIDDDSGDKNDGEGSENWYSWDDSDNDIVSIERIMGE